MASGGASSATVAASRRMLIADFIFEVADSGGKTTVGSHVGIADEAETHFEVERFVENFLLKDPGADHLAVHRDEHLVFARGENVNLRNLRFLMELLGAKFNRLPRAMLLRLPQSRLQEYLPQQLRVVEILRVAFQESDGGKLRLLRV